MYSGPRNRPRVALTFHGAGDPALAAQLLTEARKAGAPVTVLAVGSWLDAHPELARRILDDGNELGNHTYTHPVLPRLNARAAYLEIARCADVLRRLTGSPGRWFRPSGTARATPLIQTAARRAGYQTCLGYDVDPRDYTDPGADAVTSRLLGAVRPGSLVSLHLGHPGTVRALPAILDGLRRAGLAPVTVSTLLGAPA
ncbi:MAG: polysaccharide deacetylase family protein [Frankiaceae bacterium]